MRQTRRATRTPSTTGSGPSRLGDPADRASDPKAFLVRRWDELLRLAPPDMGLTAALGDGPPRTASDPIAWLSGVAGVPRKALEEVRQLRNSVASNRPVSDQAISSALDTLDQVFGAVGRTRLPY